MTISQAPTIPDATALAGLDPGVAYALLSVIALGMLLFYLGPGIRARFAPKEAAKSPVEGSPSGAIPPALPAVVDRADIATERLIAHLERQLDERTRQLSDRDRELTAMDRELERVRADNDRLRDQIQWRRGGA